MKTVKTVLTWTVCVVLIAAAGWPRPAAAGMGVYSPTAAYRVLEPITSGEVTLYPIVRAHVQERAAHWSYLTLDQGLQSGEVVITEAGKARGLVRSRHGAQVNEFSSGDQVNTLVLINNSNRPLVLLAGEIVTGGKQDRVIATDRIVPPRSEPLNLSVFCIEPGRWVENSSKFGAAGKEAHKSFMVQPSVRQKAMVAQNQQQVWDAVGRSIGGSAGAVAYDGPSTNGGVQHSAPTSSYARVMAAPAMQAKVEALAAPAFGDNDEVIGKLRRNQVIGVVAAVNGHIVWADLFATPEMLAEYWTKLVRSYAAEAIGSAAHAGPTADKESVLRFVSEAANGEEKSEGKTAVYRYHQVRGQQISVFTLEALLPGTEFEVHRSKLVHEREAAAEIRRHDMIMIR
jgi:hypothetical protein